MKLHINLMTVEGNAKDGYTAIAQTPLVVHQEPPAFTDLKAVANLIGHSLKDAGIITPTTDFFLDEHSDDPTNLYYTVNLNLPNNTKLPIAEAVFTP